MSERIDILLATYQGGSFLDEQLESLITQSYPHIHITIRDDGSKDQTMEIIQKWQKAYPQLFTLIPTTIRLGIKGNFSALMKNAQSNYIMFADQDDVWLPHKVEASFDLLKAMERQYGPHIPLAVHTDLKVVDRNLHELAPSFWQYVGLNPDLIALNRLLQQNVLTGCTMLMNRTLVNLAYPIPQEAVMHDWWVALTAACFGHIDYLETPTILYRQHGSNDTGARPIKLWTLLKRLKKSRKNGKKAYDQAAAFLSSYDKSLSSDSKHIFKVYCELESLPYLKKMASIINNQFYKQGLLRNLKLFLNL